AGGAVRTRRRERPHARRGLRAARAHRGRTVGVAVPWGARSGRIGWVPDVGRAGSDDTSVMLCLRFDGGGRAARALPRRTRRRDAALARRATRRVDLAAREAA